MIGETLDRKGWTRSTTGVENEGTRPFDETAVLEELERLRGAIRQARSRRVEKVAEFESFVRTSRMAARVEAARAVGVHEEEELVAAAKPAVELRAQQTEAPPAAPARGEPSVRERLPVLDPFPQPLSRLDDVDEANAAFPDPVRGRWSVNRLAVAAGVGAVAVVALVAWGTKRGPAPSAPATASSAPAATPAASPAPQADAAQSRPAAAVGTSQAGQGNRPLQVELTTVRPVWMRVIVDGERVVERELARGQRLQFGANRSIAIRAGDAGAVTLAVDGQPAVPMGPDGQIGTRTLAPRAR
jgi:hypothetical protein